MAAWPTKPGFGTRHCLSTYLAVLTVTVGVVSLSNLPQPFPQVKCVQREDGAHRPAMKNQNSSNSPSFVRIMQAPAAAPAAPAPPAAGAAPAAPAASPGGAPPNAQAALAALPPGATPDAAQLSQLAAQVQQNAAHVDSAARAAAASANAAQTAELKAKELETDTETAAKLSLLGAKQAEDVEHKIEEETGIASDVTGLSGGSATRHYLYVAITLGVSLALHVV